MPRAKFDLTRAAEKFLALVSQKDLLAFLLILICSLGAMFNAYRINAEPVWDGAVYHHLVQDYVQGGLSFSAINGESAGRSQVTISYLHRPLFFVVAGLWRVCSGLPLVQIYPQMNFLFLTIAAFYIYKICIVNHGIPAIVSIIAACWLLVSPPVLLVHQLVASPEPLVLCFTACSYYYFGVSRYWPAMLALACAILSKPSAVVLAGYFVIQLLYTVRRNPRAGVWRDILVLMGVSAFALALPYILIDHGKAAFDPNVVAAIVETNRGYLFPNLLFNFGVLWIPFAASLPFTTGAYRTGLVYLVLASAILAAIGATDWWRVWFSVLFVFVLPGAAVGVRSLTKESVGLTVTVVVALSVIILLGKSSVELDQAHSPDKSAYMWAAAFLLLAATAARQVRKPGFE